MRRVSIVAMILGGAVLGAVLVAYGPGLVRRERPVAAAPAATAPSGDLKAMLEVGRKARLERPRRAPAPVQRREREQAIASGPADARNNALRALALEDRAAADEVARRSLGDHVLFAEAARLLLIRPDAAPTADDIARVRTALATGQHDDASRASVATLVLGALVKLRSPEAPRFAALLRADASPRVQAVGARAQRPPSTPTVAGRRRVR